MASRKTRATDRRSRQGDVSRLRILEAAADIAAEFGYRGTTIEKVSQRCGLPPTSLYWHFGDKDQLLVAVIRHSFEQWQASVPGWDVDADSETEPELVRARIGKAVASITSQPDFWRLGLMLMLEDPHVARGARDAFVEIRESVLQDLSGFWMRVLRSAGVSRPALARQLSQFIMATTDGLFMAAQVHDDWNYRALGRMLAEAVEAVLKARISS
jgi:AcrR family transcriptional regulator